MALNYVTLTVDVYDGSGNYPTSGTATFTPSATLTDTTNHEYIAQIPLIVTFRASGIPTVKLLATDNSTLAPSGWGWQVAFAGFTGAPASWNFFLPFSGGAAQNLADLAPVSSVTTMAAYLPLDYPTGAVNGYVWTTDAAGNGSWKAPSGGFANPMTTLGDIIYEDATPAAARLAADTSNTRKFLRTQASGGVGQAPAWDTIQAADVPTLNQNTTGKAATADGLNSATTVISVAAATAPTAGQVLTATSGTAADWQTPASTAALQAVAITTTGSTFSPKVALAAGATATVTWTCPGVLTATGLTPALNFGSPATRTVYMTVADANGYDAIDQVILFNIGFDHTQDVGKSSLGASYDWTAQAVSAVTNARAMTGLQIFCAANIAGLTGTLDFSGCGQLQHIECYNSRVQYCWISGCDNLIRVCVELNNLASFNGTPAGPNLADFRMAAQQGATLALTPIGQKAQSQWHHCVHDQIVTGMPDPGLMPVLEQFWIWNTRQSGTLQTYAPGHLYSIEAHSNDYTSAHLANQFSNPAAPNAPDLDLRANMLTSCELAGNNLSTIQLNDNAFSQATVDAILATVDGYGTSNGSLHLAGNPAPSSAGTTHETNLTGRGWTVTTGPSALSVVQTVQSAGSLPLTFGVAVTAGNSVILIVGAYTNASAAMSSSAPTLGGASVTGTVPFVNIGATNGIASAFNGTNGAYLTAWLLPNCPAANNVTLTMTGQTGITGAIAYEVAGLGASPAVDQHLANSAATGTDVYSGLASGGIVNASEFVFGAAQVFAQSLAGPTAPWVNTSPNGPTWAGYRFATSASTQFHWAQAGQASNPWCALCCTVS